MPVVVDEIPLARDAHGVYRVGGTRVTLDLVVRAFNRGATAEEIVQKFDSLRLPDVYQVIGCYLNHADELAGTSRLAAATRRASLPLIRSGRRRVSDACFDDDIMRGLLRRQPDFDLVRAQDVAEVAGRGDETLRRGRAGMNE